MFYRLVCVCVCGVAFLWCDGNCSFAATCDLSPRRERSQAEAQELESKSRLVALHHSDLARSSAQPTQARGRSDPARDTPLVAFSGYGICPLTGERLSLSCMF